MLLEDRDDVGSCNDDDRVLIVPNLCVRLTADVAGRDEDAKLPVAEPRDQPGEFANSAPPFS
jgi:hypothetical protein